MKRKSLGLFPLLSLALITLLSQTTPVLASPDGNYPGKAQIDWIISMQDPISKLVDSYQDDGLVNAYIFDQALAIIALTDANKISEANSILSRMRDYQRNKPNGAWYVAYRVDVIDSNWVPGDCYYYRTGDIAWMVIAINFYEGKTGDTNYAPVARRALSWMDTMLHIDDQNGSLGYSDIEPNKISTEHNIDGYSAYYWRGMLDANDSYIYKANLISNYLHREMWGPSTDSNCFSEDNVFCRGYNDSVIATDAQCWAVLSLGPMGSAGEQFNKSLCWLLDSTLRNACDYNESITSIDGFRSETDETRHYVRSDLTDSVAAAFYSIGDDNNGDYFHKQMGSIVGTDGGLVHSFYCNPDDPWSALYRHNYVASAAWYYFNEVKINPFILPSAEQWARKANLNKQGLVDLYDLKILALDWLESGPGLAGDIDSNEFVDFGDFARMGQFWLCGCEERAGGS